MFGIDFDRILSQNGRNRQCQGKEKQKERSTHTNFLLNLVECWKCFGRRISTPPEAVSQSPEVRMTQMSVAMKSELFSDLAAEAAVCTRCAAMCERTAV